MSTVKKTIGLDKIGIESLPVSEQVKQWLKNMVGLLEQMHREVRERAESSSQTFISKDGNWRIIVNGNNLEFQRKESGTWTKKGAFTA